jgi:ATP-dependent DNA helicase RecQ
MESAERVLQTQFGFDRFKQGQKEVIERLMAGQSAVALFPTGAGKSICYQLPALLLPGLTLVISPLIALMKDQIDVLTRRGIAAARLDSTLDAQAYQTVLSQARSGSLRLLYVAPERFNNERFRQSIERIPIAVFAVDEAHCISEWGHNFRPDYLKLAEFARRCQAQRILALTATATVKVQQDICRAFDIDPANVVRTPFYRPNLTLLTTAVDALSRDRLLTAKLRQCPVGPTIVYVTLQRTAEEVAQLLTAAGFDARAYHAGMKDDSRVHVQEWFMNSDQAIVVATIAFGMGIDKANIRYVYHYNLPKSLENYAQEIGRAGRDGQPSTCEMFVCHDDLNTLENFIYGDTPALQAVQGLVNEVLSEGEQFDVSVHELSAEHDIRPLVVRTLLTYLELDGYLEGGTPFYSSYRFKPLMDSKQILSHFEGERREFLAKIFRRSRKAKTWFQIDLDNTAQKLNTSRQRVVRALDYLGDQGMLELQTSRVRLRYRRLKPAAKPQQLAATLHQRMQKREAADLARLQQVLDLADHKHCHTAALAQHFGDKLEKACGHCSHCLKTNKSNTARRNANTQRRHPVIDETLWTQAMSLKQKLEQEGKSTLSDPLILTRFLCGVTSPQLSRARLSSHALFGSLARVPFQVVLQRAGREKKGRKPEKTISANQ